MFDFTQKLREFLLGSLLLLAVGVLTGLLMGVNLPSRGGVRLVYRYEGNLPQARFAKVVEDCLGPGAQIQGQTGALDGQRCYRITLSRELDLSQEAQAGERLTAAFHANRLELVSAQVVEGSLSAEVIAKTLVALALALVLIILYTGVRFKSISGWSAGVVAAAAILHDLLVVLATFLICRFPLGEGFVGVALFTFGASLVGTLGVYDRVRENQRLLHGKHTLAEVVNKSIHQSLAHGVGATLTLVAALTAVSVTAALRGMGALLEFSFPLIIGLISSLYSSVCISGPLWVCWRERLKPQMHRQNPTPRGGV